MERRGAGCAGAGCGHPFLPPDDADAAAGNGRPAPADPSARGSVIRYAMFPFWACLLVPAAAAAACRLFPDWQQLIVFLGLMLALPFVWLLILRIIDCCTAGIAVSSRPLTLRYSRGYTFHTVIVPRERVNYVRIRYSIFPEMGRQL